MSAESNFFSNRYEDESEEEIDPEDSSEEYERRCALLQGGKGGRDHGSADANAATELLFPHCWVLTPWRHYPDLVNLVNLVM